MSEHTDQNHQPVPREPFTAISWVDGHLRLLDQTALPLREMYIDLYEPEQVYEAIASLRVRGAPAIGIAAAYGAYLGIKTEIYHSADALEAHLRSTCRRLASSRPTAINLNWALDRMVKTAEKFTGAGVTDQIYIRQELFKTAQSIHQEDIQTCLAIGKNGLDLLPAKDPCCILTHCNTGALATGSHGTALSVITSAHRAGRRVHVWVDETRPLLQGSRLTSWELQKNTVPHEIITDSMAGWIMKTGRVDVVITGADRVARNGDTANKIGTYALAVLARHHGIPFYVALPRSTVDLSAATGEHIPIEERHADEVRRFGECQASLPDAPVYNPAFDVTPESLIDAFITEKGVLYPPYQEGLASLFET